MDNKAKQLWNALDRGDVRSVAALSGVALKSSTFRCFNCNERFDLGSAHSLGGDLYCDGCAVCYCGAPATTIVDGSISCGKCPGSKPDGLGGDTGVYRLIADGFVSATINRTALTDFEEFWGMIGSFAAGCRRANVRYQIWQEFERGAFLEYRG